MEQRLVIVGAGLAGLTAAREAISPSDPEQRRWPAAAVTMIDKARSPGGRLATRRIGRATLDHGAQFFTVRSDRFRAEVDRWLADGVVAEWCRGFGPEPDGHPRYRGAEGMRGLTRHLERSLVADGVELVTGQQVSAVVPGPDHWTVVHERADREPDHATAVVLTPPLPQAAAILAAGPVPLAPDHRRLLDRSTFHSVLALLTVLDGDPRLPPPGALQQPDDPTFSFVADNRAKGISEVPAATFHTNHELSARLWSAGDREVADTLLPPAAALVAPATIVEHQVKRWRYSGPIEPHGEPCLLVAGRPGPLVVAGDGFAGAKVEGAFLSGAAAAAAAQPDA